MAKARDQTGASGARGNRRGWLHVLAAQLTAVAGFVDAVGYVVLAHVFVANMSGNSIAVGLNAVDSRWRMVVHRGYPILLFMAGLLIGGALAEGPRRRRPALKLGWVLLLEAVLLTAFLLRAGATLGWRGLPRSATFPNELLLVGLAATAMGVQNVSLRASGALSVYTTHVTGSLTQLADEAVQYACWVRDRARSRTRAPLARWGRLLRASPRHPSLVEMAVLLATWCLYVAGAAAGALGLSRWGLVAMAAPCLVLAALAGVELASGPNATRVAPHHTARRQRRSFTHEDE